MFRIPLYPYTLEKAMSDINKSPVPADELDDIVGGAGYMNLRIDKLQKQFEKACKRKRLKEVMEIAGELQARGYYGWAKQTANSYGITSL